MQTFIVLQKIVAFRVDWRNLYSPEAHRLILVVHEPTLAKLTEEQKGCFAQIHRLAEFNKDALELCLQQIIDQFKDNISLITNDELCITLAAELRGSLHLPGDQVKKILRFMDKTETKSLLKNTGISLPKYQIYNPEQFKINPEQYLQRLQDMLGLPIFAKPTNSAASQQTSKLNNILDLQHWCTQHQQDENFECDEFITGTLYHCESIIKNNTLLYVQAGQNAHPCFDFMSGKITGCITLIDDILIKQLLDFNKKVLMALRPLPDCVTHLEVFRRPNGELVFLEVACRAPGGMIVQMHEKHCGINFEQAHFSMQMNLPFSVQPQRGHHCAWAWFPLQEGTVQGFRPLSIKSPHELHWKIKVGEKYHAAESLIDFAGAILLWNEDYYQLYEDFNYLAESKSPIIVDSP
jgi:biotin carboxylase